MTYGQYTNVYWTRLSVDVDGDGYYEGWGFLSDVFVSGGSDDHPAMPNPSWKCLT